MSRGGALRANIGRWLAQQRALRPGWCSVLAVVCAVMAFVAIPIDLLWTSVADDREVWLGYAFTGWAAKVMTVPHLIIYAAGAYGFWRLASWMWPWAGVYLAQVAIAMMVWGLIHLPGFVGKMLAFGFAVPFIAIAVVIFTERARFAPRSVDLAARYGGWALVTGASAGIGEAFARAFAGAGLPVVLVARREDRLAGLARELESEHGIETRIVAQDLSAPDAAERLVEAVADLEIGVLVANAGFGYAGRFDGQETERLAQMVRLNCLTPVVLASRLVPAMRERGRGAVIVTGSIAGSQPLPLNGVYGATKAFDRHFGEMLWAELLGTGVDALVLEPGATETEFQAVAGEDAHAGQSAETVVATALAALGRQSAVVSGWENWIASNIGRVLPRSITPLVAGAVMAEWTPTDRQ